VGYGLLAEIATILTIVLIVLAYRYVFARGVSDADYAAFGARVGEIVGIIGGTIYTYLFARLLMRRLSDRFVAHGVVVAVQQHNDFLKTAAETIQLTDAVGSDWFGCILDIGSLRSGDPYAEIEKLVPYAVSWQIKEEVGRNGKSEPVNPP